MADDFERALKRINQVTQTPTTREEAESLVREYDVNGKTGCISMSEILRIIFTLRLIKTFQPQRRNLTTRAMTKIN